MPGHDGYYHLFMQAPVGIAWVRGPTHVFEFANEQYIRSIGGRAPLGKTARELFPEFEGQPFFAMLDRTFATGEPLIVCDMPIHIDSTGTGRIDLAYYNFIYQPTRNDANEIDGILFVGVDVTEQTMARQRAEQMAEYLRVARQAAERARERSMRLQLVTTSLARALTVGEVGEVTLNEGLASVGAAAGALALVDEEGGHLELAQLTGYPPQLVSEWRRLPVDAPLPQLAVLKTGHMEVLPAPTGMAPGPWLLLPLQVDHRTIGVLSVSFVDREQLSDGDCGFLLTLASQCAQALDRVRLYELATRRLTAAEAATRVKDEFLKTVSHELRTPVAVMKVWTEVLARAADEATRARALAAITDAVRSQARMIDDMVDAARVATGKIALSLRPIELEPLVEITLAAIRSRAQAKQIQIVYRRPPLQTTIEADPDRLQQIIGNLLANAVNFTPIGGRITVEVTRAANEAQICVTDTGEGIAPEFLPHMFEPFRQGDSSTTRVQGGLGLGLAIVADLVRMHNGTVVAHSEGVGRGARFDVRLPVLPRTAARPLPPAVAPDDALAGLVLLVVDDQESAREGLAVLLARTGAEVIVADSAQQALLALERHTPDLILSDLAMPERDGYDLIRTIRSRGDEYRRVPAVAFTDYAGEEDRARAIDAGFDCHVTKQTSFLELVRTVAKLTERRRPRRMSQ
jgi:signal transduction histidine kinase/CheY-like chemotaxis protein